LIVISVLLSSFCIVSIIYDQALRSEAGYLIFMFLAIPFVFKLKDNKKEGE